MASKINDNLIIEWVSMYVKNGITYDRTLVVKGTLGIEWDTKSYAVQFNETAEKPMVENTSSSKVKPEKGSGGESDRKTTLIKDNVSQEKRQEEREKTRNMIKETLSVFAKNSVMPKEYLKIDATVGIIADGTTLILSIHEDLEIANSGKNKQKTTDTSDDCVCMESDQASGTSDSTPRKRKRADDDCTIVNVEDRQSSSRRSNSRDKDERNNNATDSSVPSRRDSRRRRHSGSDVEEVVDLTDASSKSKRGRPAGSSNKRRRRRITLLSSSSSEEDEILTNSPRRRPVTRNMVRQGRSSSPQDLDMSPPSVSRRQNSSSSIPSTSPSQNQNRFRVPAVPPARGRGTGRRGVARPMQQRASSASGNRLLQPPSPSALNRQLYGGQSLYDVTAGRGRQLTTTNRPDISGIGGNSSWGPMSRPAQIPAPFQEPRYNHVDFDTASTVSFNDTASMSEVNDTESIADLESVDTNIGDGAENDMQIIVLEPEPESSGEAAGASGSGVQETTDALNSVISIDDEERTGRHSPCSPVISLVEETDSQQNNQTSMVQDIPRAQPALDDNRNPASVEKSGQEGAPILPPAVVNSSSAVLDSSPMIQLDSPVIPSDVPATCVEMQHAPVSRQQVPMAKPLQEPVTKPQEDPMAEVQREPVTELQQVPMANPQQVPIAKPQQETMAEPQQEPIAKQQQVPMAKELQVAMAKPRRLTLPQPPQITVANAIIQPGLNGRGGGLPPEGAHLSPQKATVHAEANAAPEAAAIPIVHAKPAAVKPGTGASCVLMETKIETEEESDFIITNVQGNVAFDDDPNELVIKGNSSEGDRKSHVLEESNGEPSVSVNPVSASVTNEPKDDSPNAGGEQVTDNHKRELATGNSHPEGEMYHDTTNWPSVVDTADDRSCSIASSSTTKQPVPTATTTAATTTANMHPQSRLKPSIAEGTTCTTDLRPQPQQTFEKSNAMPPSHIQDQIITSSIGESTDSTNKTPKQPLTSLPTTVASVPTSQSRIPPLSVREILDRYLVKPVLKDKQCTIVAFRLTWRGDKNQVDRKWGQIVPFRINLDEVASKNEGLAFFLSAIVADITPSQAFPSIGYWAVTRKPNFDKDGFIARMKRESHGGEIIPVLKQDDGFIDEVGEMTMLLRDTNNPSIQKKLSESALDSEQDTDHPVLKVRFRESTYSDMLKLTMKKLKRAKVCGLLERIYQ